jgi:hypothetical protein
VKKTKHKIAKWQVLKSQESKKKKKKKKTRTRKKKNKEGETVVGRVVDWVAAVEKQKKTFVFFRLKISPTS